MTSSGENWSGWLRLGTLAIAVEPEVRLKKVRGWMLRVKKESVELPRLSEQVTPKL